eukprot:SAG31_NODE_637_length_13337_cov_23.061867_6_plen_80_part_00
MMYGISYRTSIYRSVINLDNNRVLAGGRSRACGRARQAAWSADDGGGARSPKFSELYRRFKFSEIYKIPANTLLLSTYM